MAKINRIVNVNIALRTAGVQAQSFSDLMLVAPVATSERVRIITSPNELLSGFGINADAPVYKAALAAFSQTPSVSRLYIGRRGSSEVPAEAMTAIMAENSSFYGFTDVTHNSADLIPYAEWAEGNEKLFGSTVDDPDALTSANTGSLANLKNGNFYRTHIWFGQNDEQFVDVGISSKSFTTLPGGETWANQELGGVISTRLNEGQSINLLNKNGNSFEPFDGTRSFTQGGKTVAGEWIDVIRFRDWLCEEMRIAVFLKKANNRIPYTDRGIAVIRQAMIETLELGQRRGGIAEAEVAADGITLIPGFTTFAPLSSQISQNNKANRLLQDMRFTARLRGAIHATQINGTLTYDFSTLGE